jgi:AraC-like DNA-binding protein
MEAATPLRRPHVSADERRLTVHELVVEDDTAVRVVRERAEAGEDPAQTVIDALEIGARVLDREQAGANAEYVRAEFEKTAKELDVQFTDRARDVAKYFSDKVDEVFGADNGQLAREFEKLFSDGSAASVQNRVRELVAEHLARSREDLVRQFSAADGSNPLADFKAGTVRELRQHHLTQQAMVEKMGELEKQLQALRLERESLEQLEAERERGTAKGRTYEEQVAEAVDAIAVAQGDCSEAVGDLTGATGKTGDVVVSIDAAAGPLRGRIVFEAKDRRLSAPKAREELDRALEQRDADFAVLVVPSEEELPARIQPLREFNGDKLVVTFDPEEDSPLVLEVGYRLARARVLMQRSSGGEVDSGAVREQVERALQELVEVRKVKSQLTAAKGSIDNAYGLVETVAARVRAHLEEVEALVTPADEAEPDQSSLGL